MVSLILQQNQIANVSFADVLVTMHRDEYPPSAAPEKAEPFIDNTSDGVPMDKHSEEKQQCVPHSPCS